MDRRSFLASGAAAIAMAPLASPARAASTTAEADASLDAYLKQEFERRLDRSPEQVTSLGLDKGPRAAAKSRLSDRSVEAWYRDRREAKLSLRQLRAFAALPLSPTAKISLDSALFRADIEVRHARTFTYGDARGNLEPYVISQLTGVYQSVPDFLDTQHTIETAADADAYVARMGAFAQALDQNLERLRHDAAQGVYAPDFALDAAIAQLNALKDVAPDRSPMVQSVQRRAAEKKIEGNHAAAAAKVFESQVRAAVQRQVDELVRLRRTATHDAGVWRLPHGEELYTLALNTSTTTTMSPDEVHELGLRQVAELTAQIEPLLTAQGLSKGSLVERFQALSQGEHLFPNTDDGRAALLAFINEKTAEIRARLPETFSTVPTAPVEIRRVPPSIQDGAPNGYAQRPSLDGKRPGAYYINLKDTADWPKWSLKTLTYHEAFPGHQLQGQIAQLNASLPIYRRVGGNSAYNEGWALYAELLADEMGFYDGDPLGRLGYLQSFLFRAVRLVVDTGIHARRWSREKATDYLISNTGRPRGAAQREIDRYCVRPGQACAYKIGQIRISALRDEARKVMGAKFDLKAFHDVVLRQGGMPLTVLETVVRDWMKA